MQVILLVEAKFGPVPPDIRVVQKFGDECVLTDDKKVVEGVSMFLEGDKGAFVRWLKPFDGVWLSDNPALGIWRVYHINA